VKIAEVAGYGRLIDYEGYGGIKIHPEEPLWILLGHNDYNGRISVSDCILLADALENILPNLIQEKPSPPTQSSPERKELTITDKPYAAIAHEYSANPPNDEESLDLWNYADAAQQFIDGLRFAASMDEDVRFGG